MKVSYFGQKLGGGAFRDVLIRLVSALLYLLWWITKQKPEPGVDFDFVFLKVKI